MEALYEGLILGLVLSVLAGPILFALLQTGIEQGFRAGMMIALGVFVSDLLFVSAVYFGLSFILTLVQFQGFEIGLGLLGGMILITIGIKNLIQKAPEIPEDFPDNKTAPPAQNISDSYFSLWSKGFVINSLNPFTFFFWILIASSRLADQSFQEHEFFLFFGGILFVVLSTDTLKVLMAKSIRRFLKPQYLIWVNRTAGFAFIAFGVVLMVRVIV